MNVQDRESYKLKTKLTSVVEMTGQASLPK